jgi:hypothetical protein
VKKLDMLFSVSAANSTRIAETELPTKQQSDIVTLGLCPRPQGLSLYRGHSSIRCQADLGKEKEYRPETIPHVLAIAALESVLTVALSSV